MGKKQKLQVRLLAVALPEQVVNERRRKARLDRDRRLNHSKKYMELLGWQIMITTVSEKKMCSKNVCSTYALRWRIETMFKSWKSYFRLGQVPQNASEAFICNLVYSKLIHICLFQCVFQNIRSQQSKLDRAISALKLASIMQNTFSIHLNQMIMQIPAQTLLDITLYHCRYDKRKNRSHYFVDLNCTLLG